MRWNWGDDNLGYADPPEIPSYKCRRCGYGPLKLFARGDNNAARYRLCLVCNQARIVMGWKMKEVPLPEMRRVKKRYAHESLWHYSEGKHCPDCGVLIANEATRCRACAQKARWLDKSRVSSILGV